MKEYNFEFSDIKQTLKYTGLSLLTFLFLLTSIIITKNYIPFYLNLLILIGVPFLIFWLNKKKIKKQGYSILQESNVEFQFMNSITKIDFSEIQTYQIVRYSGVRLNIILKNKTKFKLAASDNICNSEQFNIFCIDLDNVIQKYNKTYNKNLIREKSMFEKAWVFPFLIILSVFYIGALLFSIFNGKSISASFFAGLGAILPLWGGYLQNLNKKTK